MNSHAPSRVPRPTVLPAARARGWLAALPLFAVAPQSPSELGPFVGAPGTYAHEPAGALAVGTTTLTKVGTEYHFRFVGDETIEYVINVALASVRNGRIHVQEIALSGNSPSAVIAKDGGLTWRPATPPGSNPLPVESPLAFSGHATTQMLEEHMDAGTGRLTLRYRDTDNTSGAVGLKTYEFFLEGKVLKVHVSADAATNNSFDANYGGFHLGFAHNLGNARQQHIPYMDSVLVHLFDKAGTSPAEVLYFTGFMDWYKSNGTILSSNPNVPAGAVNFFTSSEYLRDSTGHVLQPIDETANLLVTGKIDQTFPAIPNDKSPYYGLMAAKTTFNHAAGGSYAWTGAKKWFEQMSSFGIDDLQGTIFNWDKWSSNLMAPDTDQAGALGCDPADLTPFVGAPQTYASYPNPVESLDPTLPGVRAIVKTRFQALMDAARAAGYVVSLYQEGSGDPQGFAHLYGEPNYPTTVPLASTTSGWESTTPGVERGYTIPAVNLQYFPALFTPVMYPALSDINIPKPGWTTAFNFGSDPTKCTFAGFGHHTRTISPSHLLDFWTLQLSGARADYAPNAVFLDARTTVPDGTNIDQIAGSERAHSIWRSIADERDALLAHRANLAGPLTGENSHFRYTQWDSFASGIWDGRHRKYPVELADCTLPFCGTNGNTGSENYPNADAWVIPDYEQALVNPLCSANAAMGWETEHMWSGSSPSFPSCSGFFPVDCIDGTGNGFLDSWWTNTVTFGHSAHMGTNGSVTATPRSMEGFVREHYLINGLQAAYRAGGTPWIEYERALGGFSSLNDALRFGAGSVDLRNPRVQLVFPLGLQIYANHGPTPWVVQVTDTPPGGPPQSYVMTLPQNSFVATDPSGLFVFSALNPQDPTPAIPSRIDYARVPGQWEMLCSRGDATQTFNGFPQPALVAALPNPTLHAAHTIVRNDVHNIVVGASGGRWNQVTQSWNSPASEGQVDVVSLGAPPAITGLVLQVQDSALVVSAGNRLGVTARAQFGSTPAGSPITRDVTTFTNWNLTPQGQTFATIDRNGAITANGPGLLTIQGKYNHNGTTVLSAPVSLLITPGTPIADPGPDRTVVAGDAVLLDAGASTDPENDRIAAWWNTSDALMKRAGARVLHTFHAPASETATVHVADEDGHEESDYAKFTVTDGGTTGLVWADNFGADAPLGWSWTAANSGWGVVNGVLKQAVLTTGQQQIAVAGQQWPRATVTTTVQFLTPSSGNATSAGVSMCKTNESDLPDASGYYAQLTPGGQISLVEAGTAGSPITIAGFDPSLVHTLKFEIVQLDPTTVRLRIHVDGVQYISRQDTTPQGGGFLGLAAKDQSVYFDAFRVTVP